MTSITFKKCWDVDVLVCRSVEIWKCWYVELLVCGSVLCGSVGLWNVVESNTNSQDRTHSLRMEGVKANGKFLYSMVSCPWDCLKRFMLYSVADLFIPMPFRLLWEAFSHVEITVRRLFLPIVISVCSQVLIYNTEWTVATWDEQNYQNFKTAARGFEPGFSQLRAWRSNRYATAPHTRGVGCGGIVVQHQTLNRENLGSNHLAAVWKLPGQFHSHHIALVHSTV